MKRENCENSGFFRVKTQPNRIEEKNSVNLIFEHQKRALIRVEIIRHEKENENYFFRALRHLISFSTV